MQPLEAPRATSVASLSSDSFLGCSRPKPSDRFHANLGQDRFHAHGPLGVCGRDSTWVNSVSVSSFEERGGGICSLPFYIPPIPVTLLPPLSLSAFREVGAGWPFVVMVSVWKVHEEKASPPPPTSSHREVNVLLRTRKGPNDGCKCSILEKFSVWAALILWTPYWLRPVIKA